MYIDYENLSPTLEDFSEILLDYDIACEGLLGSAKNILSRAIDTIIKLFKQALNFIRNKLKSKEAEKVEKVINEKENVSNNKDNTKEDNTEEDNFGIIKKGGKIQITDWKINELPNIIKIAFETINFTELSSLIPDYKRALESEDSDLSKEVKEKLESSVKKMKESTSSIKFDSFVNSSNKITLSSETKEGADEVYKYIRICIISEKIYKYSGQLEPKVMSELESFKKAINTLSTNETKDNNSGKKDLIVQMNKSLTEITNLVKNQLSFINKIIDMYCKDRELYYKTFMNVYNF